MAADVADREAREDALEDDYGAIRYQGDYVRELIAETDYPSFDVDGANEAFFPVEEAQEAEHHDVPGQRVQVGDDRHHGADPPHPLGRCHG